MTLINIIPNGYTFTSNVLNIPNNSPIINEKSYIHGSYIVSSSSYSNINNLPYNAFNGSANSYWESEKPNNINNYKNFAFTNSEPATYVGGGADSNTWKTLVDKNEILGEWIQIQIPYKVYLDNYNILSHQHICDNNSVCGNTITISNTPDNLKNNSPKQFFLLGSNDGNTWNIIDQRNLSNYPTDLNKATTYYVNTKEGYTYFRLVINQLFKGDNVKLYQFNLFGYLNSISGNVHIIDNFTNYDNKLKYNNSNIYMQDYKPFSTFDPLYNSFNVVESFDVTTIETTSNNINNQLNNLNNINDGINENYNYLTENIKSYNSLYDKLNKNEKYDFSGKVLLYDKKKTTLADALEDDLKIMIIQENNLYILGTIAMATLLIGIIIISRD